MSPVKFSDVFGNIELSSNVKTTLKNTLVDKVTFNKNTKLMYIYLSSEAILNLATKSANGTYTDDVDRRALQDEVNALKDEINRIADSTNFNGIKLLDGSMGVGTSGGVATGAVSGTQLKTANTDFTFTAPEGFKVIINSGAADDAEWTDNKTLTLTLTKGNTYSQADLDKLISGVKGTPDDAAGKISVTVNKNFELDATGGGKIVEIASAAAVKASKTASGVTVSATKAGVNTKHLTFKKDDAGAYGATQGGDGNITVNLRSTQSYSASEINKMLADAGAEMRVSFDGTKTGNDLQAITGGTTGGATAGQFDLDNGSGLSTGGGLKLQIGDTNDAWNQLELSISNMHVDSLGIGDIDIGDRDGASAAISKITDAINQVSTSRGKLGAIQNRLEHTINNLGVTTENITAAESRIRDVDMAKEMMEFTKNSVLMQSAQAMLAQANQQPQSILQLLQ